MPEKEFVVLFEGTIFEVMELKQALLENDIIAKTNEELSGASGLGSIMGGSLNTGQTIELIIYHADEQKALSIIDPIIDAWDREDEQ